MSDNPHIGMSLDEFIAEERERDPEFAAAMDAIADEKFAKAVKAEQKRLQDELRDAILYGRRKRKGKA